MKSQSWEAATWTLRAGIILKRSTLSLPLHYSLRSGWTYSTSTKTHKYSASSIPTSPKLPSNRSATYSPNKTLNLLITLLQYLQSSTTVAIPSPILTPLIAQIPTLFPITSLNITTRSGESTMHLRLTTLTSQPTLIPT